MTYDNVSRAWLDFQLDMMQVPKAASTEARVLLLRERLNELVEFEKKAETPDVIRTAWNNTFAYFASRVNAYISFAGRDIRVTMEAKLADAKQEHSPNRFGNCPHCGGANNGTEILEIGSTDTCVNGHVYPSSAAVSKTEAWWKGTRPGEPIAIDPKHLNLQQKIAQGLATAETVATFSERNRGDERRKDLYHRTSERLSSTLNNHLEIMAGAFLKSNPDLDPSNCELVQTQSPDGRTFTWHYRERDSDKDSQADHAAAIADAVDEMRDINGI